MCFFNWECICIVLSIILTKSFVFVGKYYLVDVGYWNTCGFWDPFCGVRYDLKKWSTTCAQRSGQDLFNLRHSKLRNVVEKIFAVLKQCFALFQIAPHYPIKTQVKLVVACCILHNYIRQHNLDDKMFVEAMNESIQDEITCVTNEMTTNPGMVF